MANVARKVRIETVTVGSAFATCAVIRDAKTGRKLAVGDDRPYGFTQAAFANGESIAEKRGWVVVETGDNE